MAPDLTYFYLEGHARIQLGLYENIAINREGIHYALI